MGLPAMRARGFPGKRVDSYLHGIKVITFMGSMKLPTASCGVSKRNCAVAKPAFALTSYGAVHLAFHPCSELQGIQTPSIPALLNRVP